MIPYACLIVGDGMTMRIYAYMSSFISTGYTCNLYTYQTTIPRANTHTHIYIYSIYLHRSKWSVCYIVLQISNHLFRYISMLSRLEQTQIQFVKSNHYLHCSCQSSEAILISTLAPGQVITTRYQPGWTIGGALAVLIRVGVSTSWLETPLQ